MGIPRLACRLAVLIGLGVGVGCGAAPPATQAPEWASEAAIGPDPAPAIGTYSVQQLSPRALLRRQCRALCRRVRPDVGLRRCVRLCEIRFRPCMACQAQTPSVETDLPMGQDGTSSLEQGEEPGGVPGGILRGPQDRGPIRRERVPDVITNDSSATRTDSTDGATDRPGGAARLE